MAEQTETSKKERRIRFLTRDLPFPTNPTFREYQVIASVTGVSAEQMMLGTAGPMIFPALAVLALLRAEKNATHAQLSRLMDLTIDDIDVDGVEEEESDPPTPAGAGEDEPSAPGGGSTGDGSTPETPEPSGDPPTPTSSD